MTAVREPASRRVRAPRPVPTGLLVHLRRARDHIDRECRTAVDMEALAWIAGVSRHHFSRAFAATYGETPIRYLTRRRIERGQGLLRHANLTVTEICMAVGFAGLGSFSSRFAEPVRESPTAYRDRWARPGGPHIPRRHLFINGALDPRATGVLRARPRNLGEASPGPRRPALPA